MDTTKQETEGAEEVLAFSTVLIGHVQGEAEKCIERFCEVNNIPDFKSLIDLYAFSNVLLYNYELSPNTWLGFSNNLVGIDAINQDIAYNFMELTKTINKVNRLIEEKKAHAS